MRRPAMSRDGDTLIEQETRKRFECLTNKQIAEQTGQTLKYIANRISYLRHRIRIELEIDAAEKHSKN